MAGSAQQEWVDELRKWPANAPPWRRIGRWFSAPNQDATEVCSQGGRGLWDAGAACGTTLLSNVPQVRLKAALAGTMSNLRLAPTRMRAVHTSVY